MSIIVTVTFLKTFSCCRGRFRQSPSRRSRIHVVIRWSRLTRGCSPVTTLLLCFPTWRRLILMPSSVRGLLMTVNRRFRVILVVRRRSPILRFRRLVRPWRTRLRGLVPPVLILNFLLAVPLVPFFRLPAVIVVVVTFKLLLVSQFSQIALVGSLLLVAWRARRRRRRSVFR